MKEKNTKSLIVRMPQSLYSAFEQQCQKENRTVSELVRELMSRYLDKQWIIFSDNIKVEIYVKDN